MSSFFYSLPIRSKVIIHFSWVFAAIALFNSIYFPTVYKEQALKNLENQVQSTGEMIALSAGISLDFLDFQGVGIAIDWAKKDSRLAYLGIFNTNNDQIAIFNPKKLEIDHKELIKKEGIFELDNKLFISSPIQSNQKEQKSHGNLLLSYSLENLQNNIFDYRLKTLYITLGIFALGILVSVLFTNKSIKPLLSLAQAANEVSKGNTKVKIPITSGDEIGHLGQSFNQMVEDINQSISDLEKAQTELQAAKLDAESANSAKSIFLANMSHEIRTPMNAILGYTQLLLLDENFTAKQKQELETINLSGNNLLSLINNILDISKIEAGHIEINVDTFDLNELITGLASMFTLRCEEKNLTLETFGVDNTPILVEGDESKLRQVLINLLGNAVKFTETGGISLSLKKNEQDEYQFKVKDTGLGISPDAQRQIFEPFRQHTEGIKKGGTGLGLTITKSFVELMGGQLNVNSVLGEGAEFYFSITLPPSKNELIKRNDRKKKTLHLIKDNSVHALVVEDVKENREFLTRYLNQIGVEVDEASNGKEALEKINNKIPDIVFSDMRMPVMNGEELVTQIKKDFSHKTIKFVLVSASVLMNKKEDYLDMGFHEFITKPFRLEIIPTCLSKLLGVKFETESLAINENVEKETSNIDLKDIVLPEHFYLHLMEIAKNRNLTKLKKNIQTLENMGKEFKPLLEQLRTCIDKYDTEGVLKIMEQVSFKP